MPKKNLDSFISKTYRSKDPRDDGRQIRIVEVADTGKLRYRRMIESTVAPGTLVPNGRRGLVTPATLNRDYEEV